MRTEYELILGSTTLASRFSAKARPAASGCVDWAGARNSNGYGTISVGGRAGRELYAHRVAYSMSNGEIPPGLQVDHVCGNRACVNPEHLRLATNKQNNEHHLAPRRDNSSGYRGVTWDRSKGKWQASVRHDGRTVFVGRFGSVNEAGEAARLMRLELFTHNLSDSTRPSVLGREAQIEGLL